MPLPGPVQGWCGGAGPSSPSAEFVHAPPSAKPGTAHIPRQWWLISKGHSPSPSPALTTGAGFQEFPCPCGGRRRGLLFSGGVTSQGCPLAQLRSRECPAGGAKAGGALAWTPHPSSPSQPRVGGQDARSLGKVGHPGIWRAPATRATEAYLVLPFVLDLEFSGFMGTG